MGAADWFADRLDELNRVLPDAIQSKPGGNRSFDWCRFRRNQHCWYPDMLNVEATEQVGYSVWIPEDRGACHRHKWDMQRTCPIGEPGPNATDVPVRFLDATIPWEQGGQRGGVPTRVWHE